MSKPASSSSTFGGALVASDEELMHSVQEEDSAAFAVLYDRYSPVLKALIMRILHHEPEADELLQEVFMELWSQARHYSQEKGKPLGWMVTLARRRSIDRLRKQQSDARLEESPPAPLNDQQPPEGWGRSNIVNEDEDAEFSDLRKVLKKVITALPPAQQLAIDLAFFNGMSQREIAVYTQLPLESIRIHLELGLKKIADGLKGIKDDF